MNTTHTAATGPRSADGKRIAARNATTHGLFARDVVLPHLGEDPAGYQALLDELSAQLGPKNLLERHYTEKIAAASWRLRRLHRWQAQLFEDQTLTEDEALSRLDRVMRHETALHRQIDTAIKMLARDLPKLFHDRARDRALEDWGATEAYCRQNPGTALRVAARERDHLSHPVCPTNLDPSCLDNSPRENDPMEPSHCETDANCQNELPVSTATESGEPRPVRLPPAPDQTTGEESARTPQKNCQNEPGLTFGISHARLLYSTPGMGEEDWLARPEGVRISLGV